MNRGRGMVVFAAGLLLSVGTACGRVGYVPLDPDGSQDSSQDGDVDGDVASSCIDWNELPPMSALRGYWPFDGVLDAPLTEARDTSGHGHHSAFVNDQDGTLRHGPGWLDTAASFDGVDDYVAIDATGEILDLDGAGVSIVVWILPETCPPDRDCAYVGNDIDRFGQDQLILSIKDGDTLHYHLAKDGEGYFNVQSEPVALFDDQWHQVAMVWDSPEARLYLDGVEIHAHTTSQSAGVDLGALFFGTYMEAGCCAWEGYAGELDEASLWATALTPAHLQALATGPLCP